MQLGLVLIDIQNDYFAGGRHALAHPNEAAANALLILSAFRAKGWPIFHVQHISTKPTATFLLPNTTGAEFYADTAPVGSEPVILKHKPNSFLGTDLAEQLAKAKVDELVICGMMTHMCVDTTVRAAADLGYPVTLIGDACATRDLSWANERVPALQVQRAYLAAIDGSFARVVSAEDWLNKLSGQSSQKETPASPSKAAVLDSGPFYHGTKSDLHPGDLIEPGFRSNYSEHKANFAYLTATLDAAKWGAELAAGDARGRIYLVEPTGAFENDPNLTDQRFPGNPTRSYRTREPILVVGEVLGWVGHPPEVLQAMRDHLEQLKQAGIEAIND